MQPYKSWDFCKSIDCGAMIRTEEMRKGLICPTCKAYQMHTYLQEHGQITEEGSYLTNLESEINRLSVALDATIEEKERCRKLAVDWALKSDGYQMALERCENMKLAHEFEELLGTTSIPVAVEKVRGLMEAQWISIQDALPDKSGYYLCWYQDGFGNKGPWVGYWDEGRQGFFPKWPNNPSRIEKYWRYLPTPPKEAD